MDAKPGFLLYNLCIEQGKTPHHNHNALAPSYLSISLAYVEEEYCLPREEGALQSCERFPEDLAGVVHLRERGSEGRVDSLKVSRFNNQHQLAKIKCQKI